MEGPAQKEIVQYTDQQTADLHKEVAGSVEQITGRSTPPQTLNPEDESLLEKIGEKGRDLARVGGHTWEEWTTGSTYVGETKSQRPRSILAIRQNKIGRLLGRLIHKQAA